MLQYNVNRARYTTNLLFKKPSISKWDIIALQKPYHNVYNRGTYNPNQAKQHFHLVQSLSIANRPRIATFISKWIPHDSWHIAYECRDLQTIAINFGNHTLHIYNVYNKLVTAQCPGIQAFHQSLNLLNKTSSEAEHFVVGDFNLHSPQWEGNNTKTQTKKRSVDRLVQLYDLMENQLLNFLLPVGTITRNNLINSTSTLDLSLGTLGIESQLIRCMAHSDKGTGMNVGSDHYLIKIILDIKWQTEPPPRKQDWTRTNGQTLIELLPNYLPSFSILISKSTLEIYTRSLSKALNKAISDSIPWTNSSFHSKTYFTKEVKKAVDTVA